MLLTGFDSKYLNTLYVDKNLKFHGLIQAFSRTNRTLNDTKPYGNILDFRNQQKEVDEAIVLFSGAETDRPKEIWLVDPAPAVITKFESAVNKLKDFMSSQGLECAPEEVVNLKGDEARGQFINLFKEIQRIKTQLNQYTDISDDSNNKIETIISADDLQAFRGVYLGTAQQLKAQQRKSENEFDAVNQLDFEFVLFASALIDYDYIVTLISEYTNLPPAQQTMSRKELIGLINADAKFVDERVDIAEYINTLEAGKALNEKEIREGYLTFKSEKFAKEIRAIAEKNGLQDNTLSAFINGIIGRMIFDGEQLTDLLAPLELSWKTRREKELTLMEDLIPLLKKLAQGKDISGLKAYEE